MPPGRGLRLDAIKDGADAAVDYDLDQYVSRGVCRGHSLFGADLLRRLLGHRQVLLQRRQRLAGKGFDLRIVPIF